MMALMVVGLAGCFGGRPLYPVRGQVLVNGSPAAEARVALHPLVPDADAKVALGVADAEGRFTLTTDGQGPGVAAGEYAITIEWPRFRDKAIVRRPGPDRLNGKYLKPDESTLRATIRPGTNELPLLDLRP
jgi:hypothetical protein